MSGMRFTITKRMALPCIGRTGVIQTPHGDIRTPAFIAVGTKATVKALTPEQIGATGVQAILSNTYHLYLEPGERIVAAAGGLSKFSGWGGPTMTDSGGFQVFSLGSAYKRGVTKVARDPLPELVEESGNSNRLARVDEDGVEFISPKDGSIHRFTPERSIEIQHVIGADILVAFDECTSPQDPRAYQEEALERTHRWALRSLEKHQELGGEQALYGVVQGGKYQDLREYSARTLAGYEFDGFAIGGSFTKEDIGTAVRWVNNILPEDRPRHLLGIGEPVDLFLGIENGVDTFDCVAPTRQGRTGALYTRSGRINIRNARFVSEFVPIDAECDCYTCRRFTRAYLAHLFRSEEMLAATLASIHNLRFVVRLVDTIRERIETGGYEEFRDAFLARYYSYSSA